MSARVSTRDKPQRVLVFIGTRPEAIKMAPIVSELKNRTDTFSVKTILTSQHREMLEQALRWFDLQPDADLAVMRPEQQPADVIAAILSKASEIIAKYDPHYVLVQGDTGTAMAAAMAGFYNHVPVVHVEAGLRSGSRSAPWPEETNRIIVSKVASIHFCPTKKNAATLKSENTEGAIYVVGNTVLDALKFIEKRISNGSDLGKVAESALAKAGYPLVAGKKILLVTGHRRESFGEGLENICRALTALSQSHPELDIVYPVHKNPVVRETVSRMLGRGAKNIFLIPPLDYATFVLLMSHCYLILTDSGGIQEEASFLGKPALVMRDRTERREALECGAAQLVGTHVNGIVDAVTRVLSDCQAYHRMATAQNPFGDGKSAQKIASILERI